jgi:hypothetical protein
MSCEEITTTPLRAVMEGSFQSLAPNNKRLILNFILKEECVGEKNPNNAFL